jgi:hypothetical protein
MWTIGYDDEDGNLHLAIQIKDEFQHQGLGAATWKWTVERLLPHMLINGVQVKGHPLQDAFIRAITHPYHLARELERAGFRRVREYVEEAYRGQENDGRRILYEIPVRSLC